MKQRKNSNALVGIVGACCFACFWVVLGSAGIKAAREHDFLNLYTGATLAARGSFAELHNPATQLEVETQLLGPRNDLVPFVRPHFYAALLQPLSWASFDAAFWLWIGMHSVLLAAVWVWAGRRWGADAVLFAAMYLPTALGIAHSQDGVFLLWVAIASYILAERRREFGSGMMLALGLMKFHLLLMMPLGMLVQRRWRMLAGFVSVAVSEVLYSLLTGGLPGALGYFNLLQSQELKRLNPSPEQWISIHSFAHNLGLGAASSMFTFCGLALAVAFSLRAIAKGGLAQLWVIGLACSLAVAPHVYGYDAAILLLPLLLTLFDGWGPLTRSAAGLLITPMIFFFTIAGPPWAALPALALCFFLAATIRESLAEHAPLESPTRTVAA